MVITIVIFIMFVKLILHDLGIARAATGSPGGVIWRGGGPESGRGREAVVVGSPVRGFKPDRQWHGSVEQ